MILNEKDQEAVNTFISTNKPNDAEALWIGNYQIIIVIASPSSL